MLFLFLLIAIADASFCNICDALPGCHKCEVFTLSCPPCNGVSYICRTLIFCFCHLIYKCFFYFSYYLFFNSPQDHHLVRAVLLDPLGLLDLLDLTGIVNVQLFNKRFAVPAVVVASHGRRTQEVNKVVFVVTAATVLGLGLQDQILQDLQDLLILHRTHLVHFHHLFHYQIQTIIGSSYQI